MSQSKYLIIPIAPATRQNYSDRQGGIEAVDGLWSVGSLAVVEASSPGAAVEQFGDLDPCGLVPGEYAVVKVAEATAKVVVL